MDIIKLRKSLPRGYSKIVQDKFGVSPAYISQMVNGKTEIRSDIGEFLLEMAESCRQKQIALQKRINKL